MLKLRAGKLAALASLLLLIGSASPRAGAAEQPAVAALKLSMTGRNGGITEKQAEAIVKAVERAGGGGLSVEITRAANGAGMIRDMESAAVDLALLDARDMGEALPTLGVLGYPFAFPGSRPAYRFYLGKGGERTAVLLGQLRVTVVGWLQPLPLFLFSAKPIPDNGADSLRGLKIAAVSRRYIAQGLSAIGVSLAPLPDGNPLDALKDGTAGAVEQTLAGLHGLPLPDQLSAATEVGHACQAVALCIGASVLSNLPPSLAEKLRQGLNDGLAEANAAAENSASEAFGALSARGISLETRINPELAAKAWETLKGNLSAADREIRELIQTELDKLATPESDHN